MPSEEEMQQKADGYDSCLVDRTRREQIVAIETGSKLVVKGSRSRKIPRRMIQSH